MNTTHNFVSYDTTQQAPTAEYDSFEYAFDYFNAELFAGRLPLCMITLNRKGKYGGYFSAERFHSRVTDERTDEIALNSDRFESKDDKGILSILVHEMAHLWQEHYGTPSRGRYHNAEWADFMEKIGLMPSNTGEPGGKRTGQQMTHYIVTGGLFDASATQLLSTGFRLTWQSKGLSNGNGTPAKDKVKYTCPTCEVNAWGKPGLFLLCGDCDERMIDETQPKHVCPQCGYALRIAKMALDSVYECSRCNKQFTASELQADPSKQPAPPAHPDVLSEIRQRLQGLKGKALYEAAMTIADEELSDSLDLFGLSFDYDESVWFFVDENNITVDEGEAADWAEAIVKAKARLDAAAEG